MRYPAWRPRAVPRSCRCSGRDGCDRTPHIRGSCLSSGRSSCASRRIRWTRCELRPDPQRAVAERDGRYPAEIVPLAQILSVEIESLQSGVVAVSHVNDSLIVDRYPVRLAELSWTVPGATPLVDAFALGVVFENPRVAVAIGDEDPPIRPEGDVAGSVRPGRALSAARRLKSPSASCLWA